MHSVTNGAIGLRERRMLRTAAELTTLARLRTAEVGLHGFTIDQLCEQVGVSRRTFFNYFASKEDAVLGFPARRDVDELAEAFVAGASQDRAPSGLSLALLDDLAGLAADRWELDGIAADEAARLIAAVEREPAMLARLLERSRAQEQDDVLLVERREGLAHGDPRAAIAVQLMGALTRAAVREFLTREGAPSFRAVLAEGLAAARTVFADRPPVVSAPHDLPNTTDRTS